MIRFDGSSWEFAEYGNFFASTTAALVAGVTPLLLLPLSPDTTVARYILLNELP